MTTEKPAVRTPDRALRDQLDAAAIAELGQPRRRVVPARWIQDPTWRCAGCHVSKGFNRDRNDRRVCSYQGCTSPVQLTFPEDRSGPLVPSHIPEQFRIAARAAGRVDADAGTDLSGVTITTTPNNPPHPRPTKRTPRSAPDIDASPPR
jgi:hypothetical protein